MAVQGPDGQVDVPVAEPKAEDVLEKLFTYHKATPSQEMAYRMIRSDALELARTIDVHCEPGPDRTAAIRKLREAVMTANASIATGNTSYR